MDKLSRLQKRALPLASQMSGGSTAKLSVNERRDLIPCGQIAIVPGAKQFSYIVGVGGGHPTSAAILSSHRGPVKERLPCRQNEYRALKCSRRALFDVLRIAPKPTALMS